MDLHRIQARMRELQTQGMPYLLAMQTAVDEITAETIAHEPLVPWTVTDADRVLLAECRIDGD